MSEYLWLIMWRSLDTEKLSVKGLKHVKKNVIFFFFHLNVTRERSETLVETLVLVLSAVPHAA